MSLDDVYYKNIEAGDYLKRPVALTLSYADTKSSYILQDTKRKLYSYSPTIRTKGAMPVRLRSLSAKPDHIECLENVLSSSYNTRVSIASINELPVSRKKVKEVYFIRDDDPLKLYKVWVFKADPIETLKELTIYHIINSQGIPTGKPIGYMPKIGQKKYPYDIAILGGIVENAGDPYKDIIMNMRMLPDKIFQTAQDIGRMIADYHVKLTQAKNIFEDFGIDLPHGNPKKEIKERFLAGARIDEKKGKGLLKLCSQLYDSQSGIDVVSHGDIHERNIVSIKTGDVILYRQFGVIDWGSLMVDTPLNDLRDFWLHHCRQALKAVDDYDYSFDEFLDSYTEHFTNKGGLESLAFNPSELGKDSLIQSVLWNIYEMYDPSRSDKDDIIEKAQIHWLALNADLEKIADKGLRKNAQEIKKEMVCLLKDHKYLES